MAKLRIRNLELELIRALENRAKRNNRSLEDEVCEILRVALDKEDEACDPVTR
jgi:plasmid stability protein